MSRASEGALAHPQAVWRRGPYHGCDGSATLGLTAQRHARYKMGLGCCRQCCAGLGVAERVVTAHGVHLASVHTPLQYGAVEQAMGRMVALPSLGLKPARAIGATTVFEVVERDRGNS